MQRAVSAPRCVPVTFSMALSTRICLLALCVLLVPVASAGRGDAAHASDRPESGAYRSGGAAPARAATEA